MVQRFRHSGGLTLPKANLSRENIWRLRAERAEIMEFHEKLQALRKQKGLTQEELAALLFVSRAAVSKWESARGYPNIDSLKGIAKLFGVTVDELLSGDELLSVAEEDTARRENRFRDLVFGLLDCGSAMLFVLPFFGQQDEAAVQAVSLLSLTGIAPYLRTVFLIAVAGMTALGILTLALQNCQTAFWIRHKHRISLAATAAGALLFVISTQPYAATYLFLFLSIKVLMLMKRQ